MSLLPVLNNIVIADNLVELAVDLLTDHGLTVYDLKESCVSEDRLLYILQSSSASVLIISSTTPVSDQILKLACKFGLRIIVRTGGNVDTIDCITAQEHGILVINAPYGNIISTTEYTCGLILALAKHIPHILLNSSSEWFNIKKKSTERNATFRITELSGKTLGIIGINNEIGSAVGQRMKVFGMRIIGYDPNHNFDNTNLPDWLDAVMELDNVLSESNYLTLHVNLTPETKHLINSRTLSICSPGIRIINCSNGGIIDEMALLEALESGHCCGAALDVFENEPLIHSSSSNCTMDKLLKHPNVIASPHLNEISCEAQIRTAIHTSRLLLLVNGKLSNWDLGLEGAVNLNKLGELFHHVIKTNWYKCLSSNDIKNLLQLPYIIHLLMSKLLSDMDKNILNNSFNYTVTYRISVVVPQCIIDCHQSKSVLCNLFAISCQLAMHKHCTIPSDLTIHQMNHFDILSCLIYPHFVRTSNFNQLTNAYEVNWSCTLHPFINSSCSITFLSPQSTLNTIEKLFEIHCTTINQKPLTLWLLNVNICISSVHSLSTSQCLIGILKDSGFYLLNGNNITNYDVNNTSSDTNTSTSSSDTNDDSVPLITL